MNLETVLGAIQEKAKSVPALGKTLKIDFGDQKLFVDGSGETNEVTTEDKEADCTVSVTEEDFIALTKGELNPMTAVMTGKIKIKGDMGVAMKLQSLLG